jgi:hypothetical protein
VTASTASPLSSPQLAVLQKPPDSALPQQKPAPRANPRAADLQPPPASAGRGRLLDIVV